ncbi:MAG: CoA pyrophosphatase [Myxococcota bacterium]|jgi:8-oxo-dGTP pyrophosphatase MutT (NUDIX family)|nr:CoA pyrophosphatase [Myxococcota bacterium]
MAALDIALIRERFTTFAPMLFDRGEMRCASVLLLLEENPEHGLDVVFTRRSSALGVHSGQVAFPGGGMMQGESLKETALREAQEEIALLREHVDVFARLSDMITITDFHVTPFVGYLAKQQSFLANPEEVARVFRIPLAVLAEPSKWVQKPYTYAGKTIDLWHLYDDGEDLWGVTARILFEFLGAIGLPSPIDSI